MTADERNAFCEEHRLGVTWEPVDQVWLVNMDDQPFEYVAQATHRDTAIDLAADRLAERGML